jgi:methylmalonyl-CoA/ethylmalonyl-CoA epimerase
MSHKFEEVVSEGVTNVFLRGPNKIELLAATNPESPITSLPVIEFTISL